jgi:hypothetical protein
MAKLHILKDEFNGTVVKAALWAQFTAGSATFTYDATGAQVNFPATTSSSTDADDSTQTTYDLLDSYAFLNILAIPASGATNSFGLFRIQNTSSNMMWWRFNGGNIQAVKTIASVETQVFTATWNATTHAWIRIRESNGTVYWDTSLDGIDWTNRASTADSITLTAMTILLGGISTGVDASPGTFKWRSFNISPASKPGNEYRYGSVGDGMSRSEGWT